MRSAGNARKQCWIDPDARIGEPCLLGKNITIAGCVMIGEGCEIGHNSVIGSPPQSIGAGAEHGGVIIGNRVVIRENVVIHAAIEPGHHTIIEDGCYIMAGVVVNHDCHVEDHAIITSGAMLAGHVHVMKTANIGQGASVHQFSVIGTGAIVGVNAAIVKDVPPYMKCGGVPARCLGENVFLSSKVSKAFADAEFVRFNALRHPKRGDRMLRW